MPFLAPRMTLAAGLAAAVPLLACDDGRGPLEHHTAGLRHHGGVPTGPGVARAACAFEAGARVHETLGLAEADRAAIPVDHVLVVMKENRSFDHLLGRLHALQPDTEPIPDDFTNPTDDGTPVSPFPAPTTCIPYDPAHGWSAMHAQVDGGAMDGFVTSMARSTGSDGTLAMSVYGPRDLPFYYWLASTFALADRHFPSARSATFPNRDFMLLGTADGVMESNAYPNPATPSLFDALDARGVAWGLYSDDEVASGALGWGATHAGVHGFDELVAALDDGTLPAVSFVDGIENVEDDHPAGDLQVGERWLRNLYEHAAASPLWPRLAIIWTYDEGGGFFDHVEPPDDACVARPEVAVDRKFRELGARVPLVVISPWARAGFVSHTVEDHTAITRFIETLFDLPALTRRDANSTALLELFDFATAAFATPPEAPAAGTGGCAAMP